MKHAFAIIAVAFLLASCSPASHTVYRSTPQGDFVPDTRKPVDVCNVLLQADPSLKGCDVTAAKASQNEKDCVEGMSPAGCFACTFHCP